jgi:hypothetical protein
MRRSKSGQDIIDDLLRHISSAQKDIEKLEASGDALWRQSAAWNTLVAMRQMTQKVLIRLIRDLPAPERPLPRRTPKNSAGPALPG